MRTYKLFCDIGITDIITKDKERNTLKSYITWKNMISRCYSTKIQLKHPSYIGCTVCDEWKYYSNFKKWYDKNYIDEYELDKDILIDGNKIYSPETCCFIPKYINTLFLDCNKARGQFPLGVYYKKKNLNYCAQGNIYGKQTHMGSYNTINEAYIIYKILRLKYCIEIAYEYLNKQLITESIYNRVIDKAFTLYT